MNSNAEASERDREANKAWRRGKEKLSEEEEDLNDLLKMKRYLCVCFSLLFFRRQFRKSTTCDISSDEIQSNENNSESSKSTPMSRTRHGGTRRFSLVKLEVTSGDSNSLTPGLNQFVFYSYSKAIIF